MFGFQFVIERSFSLRAALDARARRKIVLVCSYLIGMVSPSVFAQASNTSVTSHDGVLFRMVGFCLSKPRMSVFMIWSSPGS